MANEKNFEKLLIRCDCSGKTPVTQIFVDDVEVSSITTHLRFEVNGGSSPELEMCVNLCGRGR